MDGKPISAEVRDLLPFPENQTCGMRLDA